MRQKLNGKTYAHLPPILLLALAAGVFFIASCGGGGTESNESSVLDADMDSPPAQPQDNVEVGSVAFAIEWEESGARTRRITGTSAPCDEISMIKAEIQDASENLLVMGGPWRCEEHAGTVSGVPVGKNLKILMIAENDSGDPVYWGEAFHIEVRKDQISDAGLIRAHNISRPVGDLLADGLAELKDGANDEILNSRIYFKGATIRCQNLDRGNEADAARFFHIIARTMSLFYDQRPDGVDDGLMDLGDVLDAFGYSPEGRLPVDKDEFSTGVEPSFPETLPSDAPTSEELQMYLDTMIRPNLEAALAEAETISQNFNYRWMDSFNDMTVEGDYGDVLIMKTYLKAALAAHQITMAYEIDEDIDEFLNLELTIEERLNGNPEMLTLKASAGEHLTAAKRYVRGALNDLDEAIVWVMGETDSQSDDIMTIDDEPEEIDAFREDIADYLASLDGPVIIGDPDPEYRKEVTIDISRFFAGIDLRNLLPPFSGNDPSGFFPDASMGGVIGPEIDLNEDNWTEVDSGPDVYAPNGIADVLEGTGDL